VKPPAGTSEKGIPVGQRGGISLETATMLITNDRGRYDGAVGASAVVLGTAIPLGDRTFLDARLPAGIVNGGTLIGNVSVGAHHILNVGKNSWITLGGGLGLPLVSSRVDAIVIATYPQAFWNLHEFYPASVPIKFAFGYETHSDWFGFRAYVEPVVMIAHNDNVDHQFAIQHAVEVQAGHTFYGGLRLQGYLSPTFDDKYQLAVEPFVGVEKKLLYARLGLMLQIDERLGPPAENFIGLRFSTGVRFE